MDDSVRSAGHAADIAVAWRPRWLIARLPGRHEVLSWALVNGGRRTTDVVAWHEVHGDELRPPIDARTLFEQRLTEASLSGAVGFLTSRQLHRHEIVRRSQDGVTVQVVATVGLGNALRVGDTADEAAPPGTINLLCVTSQPLREEAALEALSIATEARTTAVIGSGMKSRRSGAVATGTGTDCTALAWPSGEPRATFAGKHTRLGHLIGAAVLEAVERGAAAWWADQ